MYISASEIQAFLRCRRLWDYSGDNRRNLENKEPHPALWLGTGVHYGLETFYKTAVHPTRAFKDWAAVQKQAELPVGEVKELLRLGEAMLDGYIQHYGALQPDDDGMAVLTTEQEFSVPIPDSVGGHLVGRMDGLCVDTRGDYWVLENKTASQFPRQLDLNVQFMAYAWAATLLARAGVPQFTAVGVPSGARIRGVLYNGLRKQLPGPRVTAPLFRREWVAFSERTLANFELLLFQVHREMSSPDVVIYPTFSRECEGCGFQLPCTAKLLDEDEPWLLKMHYTQRAQRGVVYAKGAEL